MFLATDAYKRGINNATGSVWWLEKDFKSQQEHRWGTADRPKPSGSGHSWDGRGSSAAPTEIDGEAFLFILAAIAIFYVGSLVIGLIAVAISFVVSFVTTFSDEVTIGLFGVAIAAGCFGYAIKMVLLLSLDDWQDFLIMGSAALVPLAVCGLVGYLVHHGGYPSGYFFQIFASHASHLIRSYPYLVLSGAIGLSCCAIVVWQSETVVGVVQVPALILVLTIFIAGGFIDEIVAVILGIGAFIGCTAYAARLVNLFSLDKWENLIFGGVALILFVVLCVGEYVMIASEHPAGYFCKLLFFRATDLIMAHPYLFAIGGAGLIACVAVISFSKTTFGVVTAPLAVADFAASVIAGSLLYDATLGATQMASAAQLGG